MTHAEPSRDSNGATVHHIGHPPRSVTLQRASAQWYHENVRCERRRHTVRVKDSNVSYYSWGEAAPHQTTLLFIHGSYANAHWWDHIAPAFSRQFRPLALDLTGMGDSEHRRQYYTPELYAEEIESVIADAGADGSTVLVGHSFGGSLARITGARNICKLLGVVLVDPSRSRFFNVCANESRLLRWLHAESYPSQRAAVRRFSLQPSSWSTPRHVLRYLAEHSIKEEAGRWRWKSDPHLRDKIVGLDTTQEEQIRTITQMGCRVGVICGARSHVYHRQFLQHYLPDELNVEIDRANHHVFLDQPLAFIEVLSGMLSLWGLGSAVSTNLSAGNRVAAGV